jgi:hypothetical protein
MDFFKKAEIKKKILIIAGVIIALGVCAYLLNFSNTYVQNKLSIFVDSKFPEIKVISAAVSKYYPDAGTNINLKYTNYSDGTSEKNVFISFVNTNLSADDFQNIGKVGCVALQENKMQVDNLIVQPIKKYSFAFFNFTYGSDSLGGSCDWWLGTSTEIN